MYVRMKAAVKGKTPGTRRRRSAAPAATAPADPVGDAADGVLQTRGIDAGSAAAPARAVIRPRPVRQQRSRETLDRLLDAAEALLGEEGLVAATVPRIAARAGVSVGAVYRRFPDKDAVIRAVYGRFFACLAAQQNAPAVAGRRSRPLLAEVVGAVVTGMVASYRRHRGILRALLLYTRTQRDPDFRRQADAINAMGLDSVERLLLPYAGAMRHPDPRRAIRLGLYFVGFVLRETLLAGDEGPRLPVERERLAEELTRLYLGYLGVPAPHRWLAPSARARSKRRPRPRNAS